MTDSTIKHIATVFPISADALKSDRIVHRRRSIIREFSLNTSTHGIPGIARSESIHNRSFWTISLLIYTSIMIYFITQSIIIYFNYSTQTSVTIIVARLQSFPAVSVCNYSPVRFDTFILPFINFTNSHNLTDTNDTSTISADQAELIRVFFQYLFNSNSSVNNYLFPLKSMLISCIYNGAACAHTDFIPFLSAIHGLCFTFNAKIKFNESSVRNTTDNGGKGKLQLQLYAHSHQYVPYISEGLIKS